MKKANKTITELDEIVDVLFLSTVNEFASVIMRRRTGDVYLDEGPGEDTYQGEVVSNKEGNKFAIKTLDNKEYAVTFSFNNIEHIIGTTPDDKLIKVWVDECNAVLASALPAEEV